MAKKEINVALVSGNYFDSSKVLTKITEKMADAEVSYHDGEETFEYLYSRVMEESCFAEKRLHIVADWPKFNTTQPTFMKHFKSMLENTPSSCVIVLYNLPKASPAFIDFVKKIGKVFEFEKYIPLKNAGQWIAKDLAGRNIEIDQRDAASIAEFIGDEDGDWKKGVNVDRIIVEIEKLLHYVGKRKKITSKDIELICSGSYNFVVFTLFNKFDEKDYCGALSVINQSLSVGNTIDGILFEVLYAMNSRYSLIWYIKESLAAKKSAEDIQDLAGKLVKFEKKGTGFTCHIEAKTSAKGEKTPRFSRAYIDMIMRGNYFHKAAVEQYNRKQIFLILEAIHETFRAIRVGTTEAHKMTLLESLCMIACRYDIDYDKLARFRRMDHDKVLNKKTHFKTI